MPNYLTNDFYFSDDGDFILSASKDLQTTSTDKYRSFIQGIKARLNFNKKEWSGKGTNIGANLSDFVGKPNNEDTGEQIKTRVILSLTQDGFIATKDLFVDVIPISLTMILVKLNVKTPVGILNYNTRFSFRENEDSLPKGQS